RLRRLERAGIVEPHAYSQHPYRVEYRLTPDGYALGSVVDAIATWGVNHFPGSRRASRGSRESLIPADR
ncbi:MAG: helix-turn-helix transcriptional regulator, partial [Chloroflexi bacterium]|nr:helix-turn-helix transcriptional regulator [Chloroflexota bacterium]